MNLYNNIFGNKAPISAKEMEDYLSGKLSDKEMHDIELRAQSSDIDFDAFEAYQQNPEALKDISKLKTDVSSSILKSTSYLKYFIITGIAASIGVFIFFYPDIFTNQRDNNIAQNTTANQKIEIKTSEKQQETKSKELFEENAEESSTLVTSAEEEEKPVKSEREKTEIKRLKQKQAVTIDVLDSISGNAKLGFTYNAGIKYLARYKCVDYSLYDRDNANKKNEQDRGLDPEYANLEDKKYKRQSLNNDLNLSYFAYLEKALYKYKKAKYSEAIAMYNTILSQYKNDLNAQFYKAMALYQLGKYEKAILFYNQVIDEPVNVFDQEAEYYKALSLLHTNKAEGKKLLQKIAEDAMFYSQKAQIKLSEID